MSSRDRLLTAMRGQQPDRVPISPRMHPFLLEYYGCACWLHYLRAAEEFGFDPIILLQPWHHVKPDPIPNYISYPLNADYGQLDDVSVELNIERIKDGVSISRIIRTPRGVLSDKIEQMEGGGIYGIDPTPVIEEPLLKGPEDLEKLSYLFPDPGKLDLGDIGEIIRVVGERGLVEVQIDSAIDQRAGDAYGHANLMMACYDDPDFVTQLLRICQDQVLRETRAVLEAGVQVVFASWFYASLSAGWSPKLYRKLFLPLVKEHVDLVHSYGALYHYYDDGKCVAILDDIVASGADVISTLAPPPFGDVDLTEVKARVGDRICLMGNIDLLYVVKRGTPGEIKEAVRKAIEAAAPGGGYILVTSDAIRDGTPPENVKAFCEAGRRYGQYTWEVELSKLNVLITYRWYPLDERLIQRIRDVSPSLQVTYSRDEREDARLLPETDILFTIPIPEGAAKSSRLKWIQSLSAGVDRLRDSDVWDSDIVVTTSTGIHATPIAEYVLGSMLIFTRRLYQVMRTPDKDKMWDFFRFVGGELRGQTLGIIGYGSIGREVGRLARCFGTEVLALRRSPGKEPPPQYVPPELKEARSASAATAGIQVWPPERLPELLHKSDFVLLSLPLTEETKHLIGEDELRMMKPSAYLINIARGALINEIALTRALKEGWIAGAGLDVFETEPLPEGSELHELPNVILTPHMAAHTTALFERCVDVFCENLRRYTTGQPLLNVVNKG